MSELGEWNSADVVVIDEEWIKRDGRVYRRFRFVGHAWGDWEHMPLEDIPWTVVRRLDELREAPPEAPKQ